MINGRMDCIPVNPNSPCLLKDESQCVHCSNCLDMCIENVGVATSYIKNGMRGNYDCIGCGQCTTVCSENALIGKPDYQLVKQEILDPYKIVVFSTSPSVRVGLGDAFRSKSSGSFVEGQMVDALRKLGGDYVLDVAFAADLTIWEEGSEFLKRFTNGGILPQFTSCCPAWVRHLELTYPELIPHLSTAKSPIGMQGATVKTYFAKQRQLDPERIVHVAVTPCTAKKMEIKRKELTAASDYWGYKSTPDTDYAITTNELAMWMKEENIHIGELNPHTPYDKIMSESSGAGLIFGNTGGVTEAVLRMLYTVITGKEAPAILLEYKPVRGLQKIKVANVHISDNTIKVAVLYGLDAIDALIERNLYKNFDFIEVMTCPGGCIGGAGQPIRDIFPVPRELCEVRINSLYHAERNRSTCNSLHNGKVVQLYDLFYDYPLSELSEKMLHTIYHR